MSISKSSLPRWFAMAWIGALALGAPAVASHDRPTHRRARLARAVQRLDLSADQRAQVRGILERHRSTVRDEREALRAGRRAQFEAVHEEAFDEEKIRAAAAGAARAHADLAVTRARISSEMRALLTSDQRRELDDMLVEARARRRARGSFE